MAAVLVAFGANRVAIGLAFPRHPSSDLSDSGILETLRVFFAEILDVKAVAWLQFVNSFTKR